MRILVVNWQDRLNPEAGGAEVHLHQIFGRLVARGHDVSLLVSGWESARGEEIVDGMRVVRTGTRYTFPLHVRRGYRSVVAAGGVFDVVVEDINKLLRRSGWTRLSWDWFPICSDRPRFSRRASPSLPLYGQLSA